MKKFTAFTLIEVLVVIAVFSIGILATFHWMTNTFRNEAYADTQIKSAFFAREWIELMFNLRDANYHKEVPWNCIFSPNSEGSSITEDYYGNESKNPYCKGYFKTGMILKIWIWTWSEYIQIETGWELKEDFLDNFNEYQIYYHSWVQMNEGNIWFIFNHTWTDEEKTKFARYLVITWVTEWENMIPESSLLKLESHVLYERMWTTWEKVIETFIWNYEF